MIQDGALKDVEAIFAAHVSHEHPTSIIGSRPGPVLAGCGFFRAVISGNPHHSVDPLLAASAAVISLQGIVSRESNPLESQVIYIYLNLILIVYSIIYSIKLPIPISGRRRLFTFPN